MQIFKQPANSCQMNPNQEGQMFSWRMQDKDDFCACSWI